MDMIGNIFSSNGGSSSRKYVPTKEGTEQMKQLCREFGMQFTDSQINQALKDCLGDKEKSMDYLLSNW